MILFGKRWILIALKVPKEKTTSQHGVTAIDHSQLAIDD